MSGKHAIKDVSDWVKTSPSSLNQTRIVKTDDVYSDFISWAKSTGRLQHTRIGFGLAIVRVLPGIYATRIKSKGLRSRVYVLPYEPMEEDLL